MMNHVPGVLAVSVGLSLAVALLAGPVADAGAFAAAAVIGSLAVVAVRSQRDRRELERELVRIPIHRVIRDEPPVHERL